MPDLLITDEMVETSADAQWRYEWPRREFRCEPDDLRDFYCNSARAALEAVAPLIAAKAWEEGYTEGSRGRMWDSTNPYCTDELSERFAHQHQTRTGAIKELADLL